MNKQFSKGQISIFVIVSLIIVIGAVVLISFNFDKINIFADEKSSYKIKQFVETCLESESKVAIDKIGLSGGWLYHRDMIFADMSMPDIYNKKAQGLSFLGEIDMPYWYYYDDSDEVFKTNIPPYDTEDEYSLKNQVKMYLEDNLDKNCIRGFITFQDVYEIEYEPREIKGKISVDFDQDNIIVSLDMPLNIIEVNKDSTDYVDYFDTKLENKLWIPYHMGLDIVSAEMKSSFIEHRVLNFLNPYQSANTRDMLPPFYDFKMEYDFEPWEVEKVEKLTKEIVSVNIGLVQDLNTNYYEQKIPKGLEGSEFVRGFVQTYTKDYLSEHSVVKGESSKIFKKYRDYSMVGVYESAFFPMSFKLSPSMGNVILLPRPEAVISFLPFFFTEYTAVYEMTFPVVFEIKNAKNLNDNFVFKVPIEVNIDHNTPLADNWAKDLNVNDLGLNSAKSLICNPVQFISDYIYLNITDPIDDGRRKIDSDEIGVDGAFINFDCKGISNCFIGQTKINGFYTSRNITELKFRVPINCEPGKIEITKFGHKKIVIDNLNPKVTGEINLGEQFLPSKKSMDLTVKLVEVGKSRFSVGTGLSEFDNGFIIFTNLEDDTMVEVVKITRENQDSLKVDLTTGNYSVEGFIIYNNTIVIPQSRIEGETIPEMKLKSWVRAGVEIEKFPIRVDELLQNSKITINFVDFGLPSSISDLEKMGDAMGDLKGVSDKPYFD